MENNTEIQDTKIPNMETPDNTNTLNNTTPPYGGMNMGNNNSLYPPYMQPYIKPIEPDHPFFESFLEKIPFFFIASLIYTLLYHICRYHNDRGITTPIIAGITAAFFLVTFKKIGIAIKKYTYAYLGAIVLLSIRNFTCDDSFIISANLAVSLLLIVIFIIHNAYDCSGWTFGAYIKGIIESTFGILPHMFMEVNDIVDYKHSHADNSKEKNKTGFNIFLGICIALLLLVIILPLLGSADKYFGEALMKIYDSIFSDSLFELIGKMIGRTINCIFILLVVYGLIRKVCKHDIEIAMPNKQKSAASIAVTVNSILGFVYVIFSGFQIFYLFLGKMTVPESATYAEYAREGFFQLVFVCLINMLLVLIFLVIFENTMALKISLTVLSVCTYIMMASSTIRMIMYVQAYDMSYLRFFVFWALIVIFMIMNGIMVYTYRSNFPMINYAIITLCVLYIIFAYSNPTTIIAKYNLEKGYASISAGQAIDESDVDLEYLHNIYNAGSAKIMLDLAIEHDDEVLYDHVKKLHNRYSYYDDEYDYNFLHFNTAKYSEEKAFERSAEHFR